MPSQRELLQNVRKSVEIDTNIKNKKKNICFIANNEIEKETILNKHIIKGKGELKPRIKKTVIKKKHS